MSTELVQIKTEPDWFEDYNISQGFVDENRIHLSGQAAIDPETGEVIGEGNFIEQAKQTLDNIERVLNQVDCGLEQIVKVQIYLTDMENFSDMVQIRADYFSKPYPADTIIEVSSLAIPELLIEIDATAVRDARRIMS